MKIYGKEGCFYCTRAKELADRLGIPYEYYDVVADPEKMAELKSLFPEARQVPQIFVGDEHIGGYDRMKAAIDANPEIVKKWSTPSA